MDIAQHCVAAVQVSDRALAQSDAKAALRTVMKSWLPLSEAVLGMAVEQLPDPITAAPERLPRLLALSALDGMAPQLSPSIQQVIARDLWQQPVWWKAGTQEMFITAVQSASLPRHGHGSCSSSVFVSLLSVVMTWP